MSKIASRNLAVTSLFVFFNQCVAWHFRLHVSSVIMQTLVGEYVCKEVGTYVRNGYSWHYG